MYDLPQRLTAYAEYVNMTLPQRMREGRGLYSYTELASLVGLKPTGNFRRRVKALVAKGVIDSHAVFTSRGGIETRFTCLTEPVEGIPF